MTPKEKAKELTSKFYDEVKYMERAKQCALIAVDETLDIIKRNSKQFRGCMDFQMIAWYEEVKLELTKL